MLRRGKADKDRYARPKRRSDHASPSSSTRSRPADGNQMSAPPPLTGPPSAPPPVTGPTNMSPVPPQPQVRMFRRPIQSSQSLFGLGVGLRLAIAAIVIAAVAIPLISVGNTVSSINLPTPAPVITGIGQGAPNSSPAAPRKPSKPVSYLTVAGVRAGLAFISRRLPGARLADVRLDSKSLIASAGLPGGRVREVVLNPALQAVTPGSSTGQRLVSLSQIRPEAVARIVAGMKHRFHLSASQIDYMVTAPTFAGGTQWVVFAKTPGHPGFTATLSGDRLRRLPG